MMFLIRKKLASRQPKVAFLAVALVETLVKNCGTRLHAAVNDEGFMKELAKTARKYLSKTGAENREVAEIAMDIIQAWGEAFLPRQRQFPNIVRTYQDMRKEGLPFKAQYDSSRVPIFTPSGVSTSGPGSSALSDADTDAILAAALAASMIDNPAAAQPHSGGQAIPATSASKLPPEVEALSTSISLLADLIAASSSARDLAQNDLAAEMAAQIGTLHPQLMSEIETQLIRCTEGLEELFVIHDAALCIAGLYRDAKSGTKSIEEVMSAWQATAFASRVSSSSETSTVAPHASAPPASSAGTADLLDLPDATPASAPTASSSSNGSGLLDLNTLGISFNPPAASKAVTGMTTATILSDTTTMGIHAMATAASASTTATRRPSGGSVPTLAPPSQQAAARKPSINASSSTNTTPAPVAAPVPKVVEFDPFGSAPSSSIDELLQATAPGAVWSSAGSGSGVPANSTGSAADSLDALLTVATRPVDTIPPPIAQGASNSSLGTNCIYSSATEAIHIRNFVQGLTSRFIVPVPLLVPTTHTHSLHHLYNGSITTLCSSYAAASTSRFSFAAASDTFSLAHGCRGCARDYCTCCTRIRISHISWQHANAAPSSFINASGWRVVLRASPRTNTDGSCGSCCSVVAG